MRAPFVRRMLETRAPGATVMALGAVFLAVSIEARITLDGGRR